MFIITMISMWTLRNYLPRASTVIFADGIKESGTVLTMLLTGRAVALFSFIFLKPMLRACGLEGMNEQEQTA